MRAIGYALFCLIYYPWRVVSETIRGLLSIPDDLMCLWHVMFIRNDPEAILAAIERENRIMSIKRQTIGALSFWWRWVERKAIGFATVCIDFRFNSADFFGPFKRWLYIARVPGSALTRTTLEAAELAVEVGGAKVLIITTHADDCTARKSLVNERIRGIIPNLSGAIAAQRERLRGLLERPVIAARVKDGSLAVGTYDISTKGRWMNRMSPDKWVARSEHVAHTDMH